MLSLVLVKFDNHELVDGLVGNHCYVIRTIVLIALKTEIETTLKYGLQNLLLFHLYFQSFFSSTCLTMICIVAMRRDFAQSLCAKSLGKDFEQGFKTLR